MYTRNKMNKSIIIGTGHSVNSFFKDKATANKILNKDESSVVAFHKAFPLITTYYDCVPEYWLWADPEAAIGGLKYLIENKSMFNKGRKIKILLLKQLTTEEIDKVWLHFGSSPVWREPHRMSLYYGLLEEVKNLSYVDIIPIEATTTKLLFYVNLHKEESEYNKNLWEWKYNKNFIDTMDQELVKYIKNIVKATPNNFQNYPSGDFHLNSLMLTPEVRFNFPQAILGTFPFRGNNSFVNKEITENKLTSFVIPILQKLGCKNLGVLGFDYGGGRFYDVKGLTTHGFDDKKIDMENNSTYKALNLWNKVWYPHHKMKLYSMVKREESRLNMLLEEK